LRRRTKKTTSATRATNSSDPPTAPAISGALSVGVGVEATMMVVDDARPEVVGVEGNCAIVVGVIAVADVGVVVVAVVAVVVAAIVDAVVAPITVADVDVVMVAVVAVVIAAIVDAVGGLAAVQVATGRLEQPHGEGLAGQSCGFV
jgi:hypothetical protein